MKAGSSPQTAAAISSKPPRLSSLKSKDLTVKHRKEALMSDFAKEPAPDATGKCGELVTVAWFQPSQRCCDNGWMEAMAWQEGEFSAPVVLRSQAVELLAEEIRRERDLAEKQLSEVVDRMSDDYLALKAELDQAVGVIEDRSSEYEALEAKLAAAEKALEPFVSFFNEAMKGFTEGYAERTPSDKPVLGWNNAYLLMQHFIEARATLGGKPS